MRSAITNVVPARRHRDDATATTTANTADGIPPVRKIAGNTGVIQTLTGCHAVTQAGYHRRYAMVDSRRGTMTVTDPGVQW